MKTSVLRKNSTSKQMYEKLKFKNEVSFTLFKTVVSEIHKEIANGVVEFQEGFELPNGLGRIIILKSKQMKNMYSAPKRGKKVLNLHSFGYVYKVNYREKFLLKYPYLYRFKPHRQNVKIPLYNHIMNTTKDYNTYA